MPLPYPYSTNDLEICIRLLLNQLYCIKHIKPSSDHTPHIMAPVATWAISFTIVWNWNAYLWFCPYLIWYWIIGCQRIGNVFVSNNLKSYLPTPVWNWNACLWFCPDLKRYQIIGYWKKWWCVCTGVFLSPSSLLKIWSHNFFLFFFFFPHPSPTLTKCTT